MQTARYFYCHGLPGSEREVDFLSPEHTSGERLFCLDRMSRGREHPGWEQRALDAFDQARGRATDQPIRLIGFSLGAMTAIHLAARRPEAIESVHLISPAAPLELGDFLARMAGRAVFQAARHNGPAVGLLSRAQSIMLGVAPGLLIRALFADATASERQLIEDRGFHDALRHGLGQSLGPYRLAYEEELRAYVRPWADRLDAVRCPVTLWHGAEDTWAPSDMSDRLAERLPGPASVTRLSGLGHFGTLRQALPIILDNALV